MKNIPDDIQTTWDIYPEPDKLNADDEELLDWVFANFSGIMLEKIKDDENLMELAFEHFGSMP